MIFLDPLNAVHEYVLDIQVDARLTKEAVSIYLDMISRIKKKVCTIKSRDMLGSMLKKYNNSVPELVRYGYLIKLPRPKGASRSESNRYVVFAKPVFTHKLSCTKWESINCADYSMREFKEIYPNVDEKLIEWKDEIKV